MFPTAVNDFSLHYQAFLVMIHCQTCRLITTAAISDCLIAFSLHIFIFAADDCFCACNCKTELVDYESLTNVLCNTVFAHSYLFY